MAERYIWRRERERALWLFVVGYGSGWDDIEEGGEGSNGLVK